jgi:hypothetical protein
MARGRGETASSSYLAEVHFIEDDLVRMADAPETGEETKGGDDGEDDPVVPFRLLGVLKVVAFERV